MSSFIVNENVGFCNALRRTLLSDICSEAPFEIVVRTNTSCQSDENLANRIGLIPFKRVSDDCDTIVLNVSGTNQNVSSKSFFGSFESVYDMPITILGENQNIDLTVNFDRQSGKTHARYQIVYGVGMCKMKHNEHKITFESFTRPPKDLMLEALDLLEGRVDDCLLALENQPEKPPKSFC
jgi:DNA-directed RNA polymerase alpha subunit